jgi:hypothetical protein
MQCIGKGYLTGYENSHGSAKHDLPDFEIISTKLPDSYENEHGSKNDNRNIRRRMFLVRGDEPWHSHVLKKGVFICMRERSITYLYPHDEGGTVPVVPVPPYHPCV